MGKPVPRAQRLARKVRSYSYERGRASLNADHPALLILSLKEQHERTRFF
jgi:hypothetical protein